MISVGSRTNFYGNAIKTSVRPSAIHILNYARRPRRTVTIYAFFFLYSSIVYGSCVPLRHDVRMRNRNKLHRCHQHAYRSHTICSKHVKSVFKMLSGSAATVMRSYFSAHYTHRWLPGIGGPRDDVVGGCVRSKRTHRVRGQTWTRL
jgi:hypothetical protein